MWKEGEMSGEFLKEYGYSVKLMRHIMQHAKPSSYGNLFVVMTDDNLISTVLELKSHKDQNNILISFTHIHS